MEDSRIRRARAWIDDARTSMEEARALLEALGEELPGNNYLAAARVSANVTLAHLNNLEAC